jgi:solute carrier family 12 sodium/potassium/chloride transporter 2
MLQVISAFGPLIFVGCFAATLSSAIASLVGAPRVFQAVAKDKLFPGISAFGEGYGPNNDPMKGYILIFFISLICVLIADLNQISSLLSNFFVASYALINFSVFHASITNTPGWRPSFKYYNKWVSLFGTVLCIAVMFLMDYTTAIVTFACIVVLYLWIKVRKPDVNWGSSTQSQKFILALKAVQSLAKVDDHVKNYRPKVIILSGEPAHRPSLIDFGNLLTKGISLMTCVNVVQDTINWKRKEESKTYGENWLKINHIKAFYAVTTNQSLAEGTRAAIDLSGLGKLCPNMVLLGFQVPNKLNQLVCSTFLHNSVLFNTG